MPDIRAAEDRSAEGLLFNERVAATLDTTDSAVSEVRALRGRIEESLRISAPSEIGRRQIARLCRRFSDEVPGAEARAEHFENNSTVQWLRIGATVMPLPDVAVGGARTLSESASSGTSHARRRLRSLRQCATPQRRARVAKIAHPERHPGPVTRKVAAFKRAVEAQARAAAEAHTRMWFTVAKDLAVVPGASLGSTGLLMGAPPALALPVEQRERDERYRKSLAPEGGMPKDVRLEMRVSGHSRIGPE